MFYNCTNLTNILIPINITNIEDYAFYNCENLTEIEIPNSVTGIGESAFRGCSSLTSIEIPNSVTSIGNYAFYYCESLTSIEIPNSVTSIGDYAFDGCSNLTSIEIPNSVTSIGDHAFSGCSSLTSIEIPNSVTSIGELAFYMCESLTSIQIPNSVTSIGNSAFRDCSSVTSIVVDSGNTKYDSRNGCNAIIETASNTLIAGCQNTIIPNSVTSIGNYAFYDCESLTNIEIPNSVTSIGSDAFSSCINLTNIRIPNSVTSIGDWAFNDCSSLNNVVIGNSVTSIGDNAFYRCTGLTKITSLATTPPKIDYDSFAFSYSADLFVPSGCKSIYKNTSYWYGFDSIIEIIPSSSITIDNYEIYTKIGEKTLLNVIILPSEATNKEVNWKSSDKSVAIVNSNGVVTAIAVGEAIITATTTDGSDLSATCKVTVVPTLAESIALDKTEISLEATETATLIATILPEATFNKGVEWSSTDNAVALVDENGVVTAVAVGEATITAITTDGSDLSASCQVTVIPTLVVSIEVTPNSVEAEENSEVQLLVNVLPENATYKSVEWSSSNDAIASVNANGLVKIYKEGNVVITATTTDGTNLSATCNINVYSGIDGVNGNDVIVATIGDNVVVKNAKFGSNVIFYAADGRIISSEVATDGDVVAEAPAKGIYVVVVDDKSFKVMVK